ncbi:hypothetical protein Dip518_000809 [Parelusimicrobium proximum]|uniref:hypothetical protein n=1 Tax=Parelusimicrobium proximum TaxID=3228953 RepID=UPI003D178BA3
MRKADKDFFIADGGLEDKVSVEIDTLLLPSVEKKISEATEAERLDLNERLHQLARLAIDYYLQNKASKARK